MPVIGDQSVLAAAAGLLRDCAVAGSRIRAAGTCRIPGAYTAAGVHDSSMGWLGCSARHVQQRGAQCSIPR